MVGIPTPFQSPYGAANGESGRPARPLKHTEITFNNTVVVIGPVSNLAFVVLFDVVTGLVLISWNPGQLECDPLLQCTHSGKKIHHA